jgi:hypothetical protein
VHKPARRSAAQATDGQHLSVASQRP